MRKARSVVVLLIIAAIFITAIAVPVRAESITDRLLEVQFGDTLCKIAEATGTGVADWLEANPHLKTNPDYIRCGWHLIIPPRAIFDYLNFAGMAFLPWRNESGPGGHYGVLQCSIWVRDP